MRASAARILTAVLLVLGASLTMAEATAKAETPEQQVERMANEAVVAYRSADYLRAVDLLERAYKIRQVAALLYNAGKAYDKLGNSEKALECYRRYVASDDADPKLRAKAEVRIPALEEYVRAARAKATPPPEDHGQSGASTGGASPREGEVDAPTGDPSVRARRRDRIIALTVGILGVAALGAGVGLTVKATNLGKDFDASRDENEKRSLRESARSHAIAGDTMWPIAAVAIGIAVYFTYRGFKAAPTSGGVKQARGAQPATGGRPGPPNVIVAPILAPAPASGPGLAGLALGASF